MILIDFVMAGNLTNYVLIVAAIAILAAALHRLTDEGYWIMDTIVVSIVTLAFIWQWIGYLWVNEPFLTDSVIFCWLVPFAIYLVLLDIRTPLWPAGVVIRVLLLWVIFGFYVSAGSLMTPFAEMLGYIHLAAIVTDVLSIVLYTIEEDLPYPFMRYS